MLLICRIAAADPVIPLTHGIETTSTDFVLPSSDTGSLFFNNCNGCKFNSLRVTPKTQYRIGAQDVSRKELDRFLQKSGRRFVMVFYDVKQPIVTRIVVHADGNSTSAPKR